jgi:anti-sigma factor RsiW
MLQSYFDGELSGEMMESATLHLASCSTCAAAAREIEEEISLMMTALAPEFEAGVPTERLRERIDRAVLGERISAASSGEKAGFGAFISGLLSFGTQRSFGYASLVMVLAFAAIFALVKLRTTETPTTEQPVAQVQPVMPAVDQTVQNNGPGAIDQADKNTGVAYQPVTSKKNTPVNSQRNTVASRSVTPRSVTASSETLAAHPVKLIPGERSYLKAIARLDSTIKANQKSMRPSLQVEYERNLAVVDRAIAATRSAAKKNPNDPDAADFMFAAYQSKVDLLNTIADARVGGGRSH